MLQQAKTKHQIAYLIIIKIGNEKSVRNKRYFYQLDISLNEKVLELYILTRIMEVFTRLGEKMEDI